VVRRLLRWVIGLLSALALWRAWSRRRRAHDIGPEPEADPAEELRRKLAETRPEEPVEAGEEEAEAPAASLDERRAQVHAKAQETIASMQEDDA
jgi:hypothetical protein